MEQPKVEHKKKSADWEVFKVIGWTSLWIALAGAINDPSQSELLKRRADVKQRLGDNIVLDQLDRSKRLGPVKKGLSTVGEFLGHSIMIPYQVGAVSMDLVQNLAEEADNDEPMEPLTNSEN